MGIQQWEKGKLTWFLGKEWLNQKNMVVLVLDLLNRDWLIKLLWLSFNRDWLLITIVFGPKLLSKNTRLKDLSIICPSCLHLFAKILLKAIISSKLVYPGSLEMDKKSCSRRISGVATNPLPIFFIVLLDRQTWILRLLMS